MQPNIVRAHVRDHFAVAGAAVQRRRKVREALRITAGEMKTADTPGGGRSSTTGRKPRDAQPKPRPSSASACRTAATRSSRNAPVDPAFAAGMRARRQTSSATPRTRVAGDLPDRRMRSCSWLGPSRRRDRARSSRRLTDPSSIGSSSTVVACENGRRRGAATPSRGSTSGSSTAISGPRFIDDGSDTGAGVPWNTAGADSAMCSSGNPTEPDQATAATSSTASSRQDSRGVRDEHQEVATSTAGWRGARRACRRLALRPSQGRDADRRERDSDGPPPPTRSTTRRIRRPAVSRGRPRPTHGRAGRQTPVLARRGQTYGQDDNREVGVLFMAVMSSIEHQFEALQRRANDRSTSTP